MHSNILYLNFLFFPSGIKVIMLHRSFPCGFQKDSMSFSVNRNFFNEAGMVFSGLGSFGNRKRLIQSRGQFNPVALAHLTRGSSCSCSAWSSCSSSIRSGSSSNATSCRTSQSLAARLLKEKRAWDGVLQDGCIIWVNSHNLKKFSSALLYVFPPCSCSWKDENEDDVAGRERFAMFGREVSTVQFFHPAYAAKQCAPALKEAKSVGRLGCRQ